MKSILVDCERMKYPNTGPYSVCLNLGSQLLNFVNPDEKLTYLVPSTLDGFFGRDASYKKLGLLNKTYLPWSQSRFMAGTGKFDVWHMTYQSTMYCPLHRKTRAVLTILDLNFLHESPNNPKNKKYLSLIQNRVDRADHVSSISQFGLDDAKQHLKLDNKDTSVIYLGCGFNDQSIVKDPVYKPARPFLFALGTVLRKKNFHVLPSLLKGNDLELIIAGIDTSPYKETIIEEARKFNAIDRLHFTGPVEESEKTWYYKNCTAFLFPSIAEGFGLPVIEAMSHGKPAFISTHTSLPEIGGEYAYYFRNFSPEAMQGAFESGMNHYYSSQPQELIRKWALHFDWSSTAKSYLSVYRSLL
jgi:glycosyltransferase involved in cell wall biosynthesis